MTAMDLLMELKLIESGWRPTGLGYWMPTYTEEEWERLSIEVHAAQAAAQARLLASMPRRQDETRTMNGLVQLKRA